MPDYVVNCAAYTAVDKAESEQVLCYKINAEAVVNLSAACKLTGSKLVHISTDYVFSGDGTRPYREDDITGPLSVYGKSKLQGEQALKGNHDSIIIRTSWLYSQYGNNFVKTMLRLGREREELRVVNDQSGSPTYAPDLADAILQIIEVSSGDSFRNGTYHYCNTGTTTWYAFAKNIIEKAALKCRVIPIETKDYPTAAPRPAYSVLDTEKIRKTFGITIPDWEESLDKCIKLL
jgi:dTDP-4-dehydrorhamnose reductase